MTRGAFLAMLLTLTMTVSANAASLDVRAINTAGAANPATPQMGNLAPQLTPGAKGFLIRIRPEDGLSVPTGIQSLIVTGPIVNFNAPPEFIDENSGGDPNNLRDPPRVQTRSEATEARNFAVDVLHAPLDYPREDTYLASHLWTIVSSPPSMQPSGNPGDTVWSIGGAAYALGSNVLDNGSGIDFMYLVATGDVRIRVQVVRGAASIPFIETLNFELGIIGNLLPEPTTFVSACLALVVLLLYARRRRK
jgi:hypothetical protein